MSQWRAVLLAASLTTSVACHEIRFEVSHAPAAPPIEDRKTFLWWSLYPTLEVDTRTICPTGVVAIIEETTFSDGLFNFITLGIYSPRTSWYYCRLPQTAGATP